MGLFRLIPLCFPLLFSSISSFSQDTTYCIDLFNPSFEQFDTFNHDVKDKKIILLGEVHYLAANPILQADLWIHLNKHFGVRNLLIEFGRAEAYLYNKYLETGDERFLEFTFYGFNQYEEFYESMEKLFEYNSSLDENDKLVVHGLDFEREPGLSMSMIQLFSHYTSIPGVDELLDSINLRLDTVGVVRRTMDYLTYLNNSISTLSLPNDANSRMINYILSNKANAKYVSSRDKYMVETFIELDTLNETYFGQFGFAHTMLNSYEGFAKVLNSLSPIQDNILVVNMISRNSNDNNPFLNLSNCPIFLYKIDPSDENLGGFSKRGQWALILKDQKSYPPPKKYK